MTLWKNSDTGFYSCKRNLKLENGSFEIQILKTIKLVKVMTVLSVEVYWIDFSPVVSRLNCTKQT